MAYLSAPSSRRRRSHPPMSLRINVPPHPHRPAWIVPRDELVDFTHQEKVPFYPKVKRILHDDFHKESFLSRQVAAINCAIRGYDLLLSLPTSAGKSLCYQLPAIYFKSSITLIVSPTKTLIENQIQSLHSLGPDWQHWAQRSHSDHRLSPSILLSDTARPRLFYICPEWLLNATNASVLHHLLQTSQISRIVIDEAHNALSGLTLRHRAAYRLVFSLRESYPTVPYTLVSASLTLSHQYTLACALDAKGQFYSVSAPSRRDHFHYRVVHIPSTIGQRLKRGQCTLKVAMIVRYMQSNPRKKGFVFVPTRKLARSVGEALKEWGVQGAEWYHAGEHEKLADVMTRFNKGQISVLVCTSAFGEGFDNKLVNFVFHYAIPQSMTSYFQETGRVGRDGQQADCILFYSFSDIRPLINVVAHDVPSSQNFTLSHFIQYNPTNTAPSRIFRPPQRAELQRVLEYCTDTFTCRHKRMADLFKTPPPSFYITPAKRMEVLYARAKFHDIGVINFDKLKPPPAEPDEDCGRCDVCNRRYAAQPAPSNETTQFDEITVLEINAVENAFRNDTILLVSELVKRLSSPGPEKMKGARASEVVEFLAVTEVLKMVFEYVGTGKGLGFRIMVQKGGNRINNIHRPIPIPYSELEPLTLPTASGTARKVKKRARDVTEDAFVDSAGTMIPDEGDSDEDWGRADEVSDSDPGRDMERDSDEDVDSRRSRTGMEEDSEETQASSMSDSEVMKLLLPDEEDTEDIEDGAGTRLRRLPSRKRKRASSSYELLDPNSFDAQDTRRSECDPATGADEEEVYEVAPPTKRRRQRDLPVERPATNPERLLARFEEVAVKKKDRDLKRLLKSKRSKKMLKRLFERHQSIGIVDEDSFRTSLREVGASEVETLILVDWYEWIEYEVLAEGFVHNARQAM